MSLTKLLDLQKMRMPIVLVVILFASLKICAQSGQVPQVGLEMPYFELSDVTHFKKKKATADDFRGKWLFAYFWYSGCPTCIKTLPKVDQLRKQFGHDIQFMLIGCTHPSKCFGAGIRELYEKLRVRMKLGLPSAYDSTLFEKWEIYSMPRIIIVDPNQIVRVITDGLDLSADKLQALLHGMPVTFHEVQEYTMPDASLSIYGHPNLNNMLYSSMLTRWNGESPRSFDLTYFTTAGDRVVYEPYKVTLFQLYNAAYFGTIHLSYPNLKYNPEYGKIAFRPELQVVDSSAFFLDGMPVYYNYSLLFKNAGDSQIESVRNILRNELKNMFGYSTAVVEKEQPAWLLVSTPSARKRLPTKGGKFYFSDKGGSGGAGGFTCTNCPMSFFFSAIRRYIDKADFPYFDETGISENIDISFDALLLDSAQVRSELRKNGLDLIKGKRIMKTLIIGEKH